ncbi:MAG: hypothetical protein QXM98_06170, partial [Thermoproteota archaeon]
LFILEFYWSITILGKYQRTLESIFVRIKISEGRNGININAGAHWVHDKNVNYLKESARA